MAMSLSVGLIRENAELLGVGKNARRAYRNSKARSAFFDGGTQKA
jgi:hypothetical protein